MRFRTRVDSGVLASQKVGNYPNTNQLFSYDKKIGRVCEIYEESKKRISCSLLDYIASEKQGCV
jgi:hypothetical protein